MKFLHFKVVKHVHVHVTLERSRLEQSKLWIAQSCDHNSDLGVLKCLCLERR